MKGEFKMLYTGNLHTHSTFSDGKHSVREIIEAAIGNGFSVIGLSDHAFTNFDTSYCVPPARYDEYKKEVRALQAEYADKIKVLLGIELDYFSDVQDREGCDYFISGVHYVKADGIYHPIDFSAAATQKCIDEGFGGDKIAFAKAYYETVVDSLRHKPLFLAHFDLITKHSVPDQTDPAYIDVALQALDAVIDADIPVEVNTGAMARGATTWPYPAEFLMRRLAERNARVTLGSDCHDCTKLDYAFDVALDALRRNGVRSIYNYDGEKFVEQAI